MLTGVKHLSDVLRFGNEVQVEFMEIRHKN
jgi:hypothetical protein